jgi:glutathione synthase/RimK-type ligase-like ATP-grasp enzyme
VALILVVAPPDDEHAAEVVPRLRSAGEDVAWLDLARFPREASLAMAYEPGEPPRFVLRDRDRDLDLHACRAIWWRRPGAFVPRHDVGGPEARRFAAHESYAAFAGLWHAIRPRWVNDPVLQDVASRKTYQLAVAGAAGLSVPRTLVTSDPSEAREFLAPLRRGGRVDAIQKTLTPLVDDEGGFTRRRSARDLDDRLEGVRQAPALLQEYVDGPDLRVIAVGPSLFAMELDARATDYPEDCRRDWARGRATARATDLPPEVARGLLELMARLGLVYGAFDLRRRDRDGEYLFLEVNPAGQWLFVENRTGLPISQAVADSLASLEQAQPPGERR